MRLLLDTHIFLWSVKDSKQLSKEARSLISHASEVYVSSISIWEITIKAKLGKLQVDINKLVSAILLSGFTELPLNNKHTVESYNLGNLHNDPFDKILLAQAISEPLILLTADEKLAEYSELVKVI